MIEIQLSEETFNAICQRYGRFGETTADFETILRRALALSSEKDLEMLPARGIVKYTEELILNHPDLGNVEIAALVRRQFPQAQSNNRSVASIRYNMKRDMSE